MHELLKLGCSSPQDRFLLCCCVFAVRFCCFYSEWGAPRFAHFLVKLEAGDFSGGEIKPQFLTVQHLALFRGGMMNVENFRTMRV